MRYLSVVLLFFAMGVSLFLFVAYSSLLDFFPWGSAKAYVIWEPLVLSFVVPALVIIGVLFLLAAKSKFYINLGVHYVLIGLTSTIPSFIGFDLETDVLGRWFGVSVAFISACVFMNDLRLNLSNFHKLR